MPKLRKTTIFLISVLFVLLLGILCWERVKILKNYLKLVSSDSALQKLNAVPPTKVLTPPPNAETISIGCASFAFPSSQILSISYKNPYVLIETSSYEISLHNVYSYAVDRSDNYRYRYKNKDDKGMRGDLQGGEAVLVQDRLSKADIAMLDLQSSNRYEFRKQVMSCQPKKLTSLIFMDKQELNIYEEMLETKYFSNIAYFFETPFIKGYVEPVPINIIDTTNILMFDVNRKFMQRRCPNRSWRF